jgi:RNA polymerase sigma-70 factor (ECF subfamily)
MGFCQSVDLLVGKRINTLSGTTRQYAEERVAVEAMQEKITSQDAESASSDAGQPGQRESDEAPLIEQARSDPNAFGVLYERYVDRIYAYIYHRVGNAQDAEDLTARTFYRALGKLDTYEDRGLPFSAWLFRIAHNLVANWHRDRSRRRFLSLDRLWSHSHDSGSPETVVEAEEKHDALWAAINRLPDDRRDLLIHKFSGRLSNVEIGELMNKSESAVKSLYFRTLSSLRQDLEARGWGTNSQGLDDSLGALPDEKQSRQARSDT